MCVVILVSVRSRSENIEFGTSWNNSYKRNSRILLCELLLFNDYQRRESLKFTNFAIGFNVSIVCSRYLIRTYQKLLYYRTNQK